MNTPNVCAAILKINPPDDGEPDTLRKALSGRRGNPFTIYFQRRDAGLTHPQGEWREQTMTNDEMKKAVDILVEYARTGLLCVGGEEAELLRRYASAMGEWRK